MHTKIVLALPILTLMASVCLAVQPAEEDPVMTAYRDALIAQLDKLEKTLPEMAPSADAVAEKLLAGGNLYADGQKAFVIEAYWRAGGMMLLREYTEKAVLSEKDVVFVGAWTTDDELALEACRRAKEAGAYVVLFSPAFAGAVAPLAELSDAHVVNFSGSNPFAVAAGPDKTVGPTAHLYNVTALWVYTGEVVGALTRKGKMPVMYQSVVLPGGRARNNTYLDSGDPASIRFHNDMTIPPQPEGKVGRLYIDAIRRQLGGLRGATLEQLAQAGAQMAECVRAGGSVHVQTISHFTTFEVRTAAVPAWVKADYESRFRRRSVTPAELGAAMKPGDIFFQLGYYSVAVGVKPGSGLVDAVRKAKGKSFFALCHAPIVQLDGAQPDMLIDAQWEYGDSAILVPGYDGKILPSSAVLQTAVFWTVVAKAESILSQPNKIP